jgi:hypothetical protein
MEKMISFAFENWEIISAVILWVGVRIIPTKKNYDLLAIIVDFIGNKIVPNKRIVTLHDELSEKKEGGVLGKGLHLLLFLSLGYLPLNAQLNGNFKTLRLVNVSDSTTVVPVNATIYYNEQTGKLRAFENGVWKDLISTGGGGGGGVTTASNGLSISGSDVRLGGSNITGSSLLPVAANSEFSILDNNTSSVGFTLLSDATNSGLAFGDGSNTGIYFDQADVFGTGVSGAYIADFSGGMQGLRNFETGYVNDPLDLATKEYVDANSGITNGAVTNELTKSIGGNLVSSGLFSSTLGTLTLGAVGQSGTIRDITAEGSTGTVTLRFVNKSTASGSLFIFNSNTNFNMVLGDNGSSYIMTPFANSADFTIRGSSGAGIGLDAFDLTLAGGNTSVDGDGGDVFINGGLTGGGTGTDGNVIINGVITKVVDIGNWDMDANNINTINLTALIPELTNFMDVLLIKGVIYNDANTRSDMLVSVGVAAASNGGGVQNIVGNPVVSIDLVRESNGLFDSVDYNDAVINRGKLIVTFLN